MVRVLFTDGYWALCSSLFGNPDTSNGWYILNVKQDNAGSIKNTDVYHTGDISHISEIPSWWIEDKIIDLVKF